MTSMTTRAMKALQGSVGRDGRTSGGARSLPSLRRRPDRRGPGAAGQRGRPGRWQADAMRITHLGHACLLVESDDVRVLVDPGTFSRGFEQLTDLDAIVVTHQHPDHVDVERLPQLLEANDAALLLAEP